MFFCDTEGLHSINDQLKELISGILTLSQICTFSIIMINSVLSVDVFLIYLLIFNFLKYLNKLIKIYNLL